MTKYHFVIILFPVFALFFRVQRIPHIALNYIVPHTLLLKRLLAFGVIEIEYVYRTSITSYHLCYKCIPKMHFKSLLLFLLQAVNRSLTNKKVWTYMLRMKKLTDMCLRNEQVSGHACVISPSFS